MGVTIEQLRTRIQSVEGWGKLEYTDWIDESESWKSGCYLGEWSFLDELHVSGPDALKLFSDFAVNSFEKFEIGQAKHIICCNRDGKVIGEGILMRFGADEFEFQALGPVTAWLEYQQQVQVSGPGPIFGRGAGATGRASPPRRSLHAPAFLFGSRPRHAVLAPGYGRGNRI
jgi:glycine cleavage system aminomethyltransferase T